MANTQDESEEIAQTTHDNIRSRRECLGVCGNINSHNNDKRYHTLFRQKLPEISFIVRVGIDKHTRGRIPSSKLP